MLSLTRKIGQKIHIGPSVVLTVVDIKKGRVRLAFDAPRQVVINREERKSRSGQEAAT